MIKFKTAMALAVGSLFAGAAFAQSNYSIEQRDRIQQARIERGIESGRLTPRETDRLLSERAQVERMERRARADGMFTQHERARVDRAQDHLRRDIYRESNDRQTAGSWRTSDRPHGWDRRHGGEQRHFAGAAPRPHYAIERRDRIQDARIDRGIQSGRLTPREAERLQGQRARVERMESRARADGAFTLRERARVDRAQDRLGRNIFRESRDRQTVGSNWRSSDRPQQFNRREALRGERGGSRADNVAPRTRTDARFGRSNMAPGRQPHLQQSDGQRTQVRQAQTRRSQAGQAQAQRSWTRPASRPAAAAGPVTVARQGGYGGRRAR